MGGNFQLALQDIFKGLMSYQIWLTLAWQETKRRYRRSVLGPIWITLSMGVMFVAMGPLYGKLLNQPLGTYFQSLAIGFVLWNFFVGCINESCNAFIDASGFIRQIKLPLSLYVFKVVAKNLIVFGHNFIIVVIVLFFYPPDNFSVTPLVVPGFILVLINLFWIGLILSILCARFRDVAQLVSSVLQILFFLTPVLWTVNLLGAHRAMAEWNIFYHLIGIVRDPLLGTVPDRLTWLILVLTGGLGTLMALVFFSKFRARISYWL